VIDAVRDKGAKSSPKTASGGPTCVKWIPAIPNSPSPTINPMASSNHNQLVNRGCALPSARRFESQPITVSRVAGIGRWPLNADATGDRRDSPVLPLGILLTRVEWRQSC
jgi:hypothetical protein